MSQQRNRHPDPRDPAAEIPSSGLSVTSSDSEDAPSRPPPVPNEDDSTSDSSSGLYAKTKKPVRKNSGEVREHYVKNPGRLGARRRSNSQSREEGGGPGSTDPRRHSLSELDSQRLALGGGGLLAIQAPSGTAQRSVRSSSYARPKLPPLPPPPLPPHPQETLPSKRQGKAKKRERGKVYKIEGLAWVEKAVRSGLWAGGQAIVRLPGPLLLLPLLLAALCLIPFVVHKDTLGTLHSPFDSFATESRVATAPDNPTYVPPAQPPRFNFTSPKFNPLLRRSNADFAVLLKTPKGTTVLREEVLDVYFRLRALVSGVEVSEEGRGRSYAGLCRPAPPSLCDSSDPVDAILAAGTSLELTFPDTFLDSPGGAGNVSKLYLGNTFGGVETDPDGAIARARALAMYFRLKTNTEPMVLSEWDKSFRAIAHNATENEKSVSLSYWSQGEFEMTVSSMLHATWSYLGYSALILITLAALGLVTPSAYRSKPLLGAALALVVVISCAGALSLRLAATGALNAATFAGLWGFAAAGILLLASLGQSWGKFTNAAVHPREKLQFLLCWDGPLLVLATLALLIAFVVTGLASTLPYFQEVCLTMGVGMALLLVLGLSLFASALYLSGRREAAGLKCFHFWRKGDTHFPLPLTKDYDQKNIQRLHAKLIDEQASPSRAVGAALAKVHTRYMALMAAAVFLVFGVWGCSVARVGLEEAEWLPKGSQAAGFLSDFASYFARSEQHLQLVFEDTIDYMDPDTRLAILDMMDWALESQYAVRAVSWLRDFLRFEQSSIYLVNRDTFVPVVHLIFLKTSPYTDYAADIAFDQYQAQIIASRMYLRLSHKGLAQARDLVAGLLARARAAGLPLRIEAPSVFLLSHDLGLPQKLVLAFLVPIFLLSILGIVMFAQPLVGLLIFACLGSVTVGTFGYAALWDVPINAVTAGTVLCGLLHTAAAVFTVSYHFSNSGARKSARSRMEYALQSSLWPLLLSCLLPLLAFLPLLSLDTPVLTHIGKLLLLQLAFSAAHALLLVPAILALVSLHLPHCCSVLRELCEDSACVCCDSEEDATSIYYIPTTGRSVDPEVIQRFFGNRALTYIEDAGGGSVIEGHYALPPAPRREALMPPPSHQPDLVDYPRGGYASDREMTGPRRPASRASSIASRGRSSLNRQGDMGQDRRSSLNRRTSDLSPEGRRGSPRPLSPAALPDPRGGRRGGSLARSERSHRSERIEPETRGDSPASLAESGSVYVVQDKGNGRQEMRHMPRHFRRPAVDRSAQSRAYSSARWAREAQRQGPPPEAYPPPRAYAMDDGGHGGWMPRDPRDLRPARPGPAFAYGPPMEEGYPPPPYGDGMGPPPPVFRGGPPPRPPLLSRASMRHVPPPRLAPW